MFQYHEFKYYKLTKDSKEALKSYILDFWRDHVSKNIPWGWDSGSNSMKKYILTDLTRQRVFKNEAFWLPKPKDSVAVAGEEHKR